MLNKREKRVNNSEINPYWKKEEEEEEKEEEEEEEATLC